MNLLKFIFIIFILGACQSRIERDPQTVFRYNESAGISSLDPAFARNQANIWACHQIYNGLVRMDDQLQVQPDLAESWEVLDSGKVYRFKIRENVRFHEDPCFGEKGSRILNASDFAYSFERLRNAELAAPGAWVLQKLKSIRILNDYQLELELKEPFAPFLGILSMKYCAVVPKEAVDYYGSEFSQHPVGTGPFYFKLWLENEKLVLRKNPHYFQFDDQGERLPYMEAVAVSFISDKQSAFLEFLKGNIDFLSGLDASYKDELLDAEGALREKYQSKFKLYRQAYLNTEYLAFLNDANAGLPETDIWQIREIRQALNHCFDRAKMIRFLRNNIGTPAEQGMIPRGLPAYDSLANYGYSYAPEKTDSLLIAAGYPSGEGLPTLRLQTNSSYLDLCEYLQAEANKHGIPVKVELAPPSTLRQAMATAKSPFFRASWIADYPDSENYLSLFYSANKAPNGPNYSRFENEQFDQWYELASRTANDSMRIGLYRKMDSLVMQEAPIIPLYYDQVLRFYPKSVQGLGGNALNLLDLSQVRK